MTDRLFFYGTLLPGLVRPPLADIVARLIPLGPTTTAGLLVALGRYPGMLLGNGVKPAKWPLHSASLSAPRPTCSAHLWFRQRSSCCGNLAAATGSANSGPSCANKGSGV